MLLIFMCRKLRLFVDGTIRGNFDCEGMKEVKDMCLLEDQESMALIAKPCVKEDMAAIRRSNTKA